VALAVGLLVLLAGRLVSARRRIGRLRRRLRPDEPAQERERGPSLRERVSGGAAGLFAATERALGGLRQWEALERVLSRADVPLRAVELLYAMAGAGLALALLALVVGLSPVLVLVVFAAGASAPLAAVRLKARRRMNEFDEQLPELLMTLASSLKAGHTFRQGIQTIVDEGKDPARKEFQRVLSEARLGRPLEAALAEMADRLASENFSFVVSAVTIQRQVGGSLAGIFDMVAGAVRQRQLFARKLKALTAQGRMSAYVLMAMPVGVGLVLSVINPGYMAPLYVTGTGHVLLLAGLGLMAIGAFLLKRIVAFAE
jgi:tight adherence protein B